MASLARFEDASVSRQEAGRTRRFAADLAGLEAFRGRAARHREQSLSSLIESEIIPRLMLAHAAETPLVAASDSGGAISVAEVEALAPLALAVEADAVLAHVDGVLARGVPVDTVLVDLLAPTARLLGEFWEADRCDFVDVTMGLWRLQEVVHEIAGRVPAVRALAAGGHRALFASMPGDQHDFGTVVIDELFRRNGWATERLSAAETPQLMRCVGEGWYDLVGLTISCDRHVAGLTSIIVALRNVSMNPRLCVMVGGRVFSADPALATEVGADGTARDAKLALQVAAHLVSVRAGDVLACH